MEPFDFTLDRLRGIRESPPVSAVSPLLAVLYQSYNYFPHPNPLPEGEGIFKG